MSLYIKTTLIETFGKTTVTFQCLNRKVDGMNENGFSSLDQKYVVSEVMLSIFVLLPFCHHVFSHIFPKDVNNIHKFRRKFCVTFFSRIQQNKV